MGRKREELGDEGRSARLGRSWFRPRNALHVQRDHVDGLLRVPHLDEQAVKQGMRGDVKVLGLDAFLGAQSADFAGRQEQGGKHALFGIGARRQHAVGIGRMHGARAEIAAATRRASAGPGGARDGGFRWAWRRAPNKAKAETGITPNLRRFEN